MSLDKLSLNVIALKVHLPLILLPLIIVGFLSGVNDLVVINSIDTAPTEPNIAFVTVTPPPTAVGVTIQHFPQRSAPPEPSPVPYFAEANELGKIMVLQYHKIGEPEARFQRTPRSFQADLQRLYEAGYYPVNFIDLAKGLPDLMPGKKPVVITFDDSDVSQFRIRADGTIDPGSAVGIMLNFHQQHPRDWPLRATFFVLGDNRAENAAIFGQPEWADFKLQFLIEQGMEVGSHTVTHIDLSTATAEEIYRELALSKYNLEQAIPNYTVVSLAAPYGGFPYTTTFLRDGEWNDFDYSYITNAAAWGGPAISPFDPAFDPYRIARIEVVDPWLDYWLTYFDQHPDRYYISDGNPNRLTFPSLDVEVGE